MSFLFGGGGDSTTTQTPIIPPEIAPFISQTAGANMAFQKLIWEAMLPGVPFPAATATDTGDDDDTLRDKLDDFEKDPGRITGGEDGGGSGSDEGGGRNEPPNTKVRIRSGDAPATFGAGGGGGAGGGEVLPPGVPRSGGGGKKPGGVSPPADGTSPTNPDVSISSQPSALGGGLGSAGGGAAAPPGLPRTSGVKPGGSTQVSPDVSVSGGAPTTLGSGGERHEGTLGAGLPPANPDISVSGGAPVGVGGGGGGVGGVPAPVGAPRTSGVKPGGPTPVEVPKTPEFGTGPPDTGVSIQGGPGRLRDKTPPPPGVTPEAPQTEAFVPGDLNAPALEGGILGDLSRNIVGPSSLEQFAANQVRGLADAPGQLGLAQDVLGQLGDVSRRRVTGGGLGFESDAGGGVPISATGGRRDIRTEGASSTFNDPAIQAATEAFAAARRPIIENQAALSGLGRSTALTNATAAEQARTLLPLIQESLGREERGIDRELSTLFKKFEGFTGLGDRAQQRKGQAIAGGLEVGGLGRGLAQDAQDAQRDEQLRMSALFEQALGGPLGLLPSTIGSTASSSGGKKG